MVTIQQNQILLFASLSSLLWSSVLIESKEFKTQLN